jgi:hypothetical protein
MELLLQRAEALFVPAPLLLKRHHSLFEGNHLAVRFGVLSIKLVRSRARRGWLGTGGDREAARECSQRPEVHLWRP